MVLALELDVPDSHALITKIVILDAIRWSLIFFGGDQMNRASTSLRWFVQFATRYQLHLILLCT